MEKIKKLRILLTKYFQNKSVISLLLLMFMVFSSVVVHAQAQLVDVTIRLRSASWGGDCDDGAIGEFGNQDIYFRYDIGYNGGNYIGQQLRTLLNDGGPEGDCSYDYGLNQGPTVFSIVAQCVSSLNFRLMDSWEEDGPVTCNTDGEPDFGGGTICINDEFYGTAGNTSYNIASLGLNSTRTINYSNNLQVRYDISLNPYLSAPAVNDPTPVICEGTTILLEVASGLTFPGDVFRWYSDAALTTVLGTGATYTAGAGTYYVAEWTGSCNGPATQVVVTTGAVAAGVPITGDTVCMGETATIVVDNSDDNTREVNLYADPYGGTLLDGPYTGTTVNLTTPPIDGNTVFYVTVEGVANACGGNAQPVYVGMHPKPTSPQVEIENGCADNSPIEIRINDEQIGSNMIRKYVYGDGSSATFSSIVNDTVTNWSYGTVILGQGYLTIWIEDINTGCLSDPTIQTFNIASIPDAPTAEGVSVCFGQSAYLTATGEPNASFSWYADAALTQELQVGGNFTTPALTTNTSYWVTQADSGCASTATQVDVTVNALPTAPDIDGDNEICEGETVELTDLNNDGTYETWWSYDAGEFAADIDPLATGATFTTQPLAQFTTIYAITVDPATGCKSAVDYHDITVNPKPTPPQIEFTSNILCEGGNQGAAKVNDEQIGLTLNLTQIQPDGTVVPFVTTITDTFLTFNFTGNAPDGIGEWQFVATITDPNTGCVSDPYLTTVMVASRPDAPTAEGVSVCSGQSAYLTATGESNATFSWYADAALTQELQVGGNFTTPALTTNTSYWVTQADSGCASTATQVDVTVTNDNAALVLTRSQDTICYGGSVTLGGGNATTVWYTDGGAAEIGTGSTITVSSTVSTYYYAKDTAGMCPSGLSSIFVEVKPAIPAPQVNNLTFCETEDIILSAVPVRYGYSIAAIEGYPGYPEMGSIQFLNAQGTPFINEIVPFDFSFGTTLPVTTNIGTLPAGVYNYSVFTLDAQGCYSPYTNFTVTVVEQLEKPMVESDTICEGEDATLTATGCSGEAKWYADAALTNLLFVGSEFTKSGLTAGTHNFYVTCNSSGSCSSADSMVTVIVNPAPELPYFTSDYTICQGQTVPEGEGLMASCSGGMPSQTGMLTVDGTGTPIIISDGSGATYGPISFDASAIPAGAKITGVTVSLTMNHTWTNDLEFTLNTPSTSYLFLDGSYTYSSDNLGTVGSNGATPATYIFNDDATDNLGDIYTGYDLHPGTYLPDYPFSALNGGDASGMWSIDIEDLFFGDGGSVTASSITIDWMIPATGGDISWWDAAVDGTQVGDEMVFVPTDYETLDPGAYTFYAQCGDATDCGNGRTPVTFTVLPALTAPSVMGDDPVCENTSATLEATSDAGTVEWYADADLTILLGTGPIYTTPNLSANTTYYAVANNGICLSAPTAYEVEVIPAPVVSAFIDNPISFFGEVEVCEGEQISIYPNLADPVNQVMFLYDLKDVDPLNDWIVVAGDGEELEINANSDAVYWLRVYDFATGCVSDPVPLYVNVFNRTPAPEVRGAEVCVGEEATIIADYSNFINDFVPENPATTIVWWDEDLNFLAEHDIDLSLNAVNDSLIVGPYATPGTYNFLVGTRVYHDNSIFLGYCESELSVVTVVVTGVPETPANLYDTICAGESTSFNTGDLGGEVRWYSDEDLTDLIIVSNTLNTGVLTATTQYWYTVSSNAGCTSTAAMAEVFVNELPTLTSVTNNTPICEHSDLELYANTDDATNLTFSWWTNFNGFTSTLQNPVIMDATEVNDEGFYFVKVTDVLTGCVSQTYSTLAVISKFPDNIIADNDGPTCEDGTIQLNATNVFGAEYMWTNPDGDTISYERNPILTDVTPDMSGTYTVVVTLGACQSEPATTEVVVYPNPVAYAGEDVSTLQGVPIVLNGSGGTTYQWLPLTNEVFSLEPNNIPNPTFYSDSIGVYELYLTVWDDDHGCSDVDTVQVTVLPNYNLEVPDLITPNGDGINDAFVIKYLENLDQSYTLSVYARAGAKVFETTNYGQDWIGTYKDEPLPDGAYWWVLALEDGTVYKGQLTIKR